ncbi:MAG: sulfite exporter TauE/SafE family protein [Candidatus Omnitrophica bacterium]|jgi:cytochrome c-type biogenesis protein|nr:sulfite exporter TauE/SafE family protein [Candidatus Omnitrophota bacterium]
MISSIQNILINGSFPVVLAAVAFAGAVASLSSCTIARLPVVWGYVAAGAESRKKGMHLSLAFICGLIVSYTIIGFLFGLITDLAGKFIQISRYLYLSLGILLFIGGFLFAGLIPAGQSWFHKRCDATIKQAKTIHSAFALGIFFAFLEMPACPCCGAVLMVIASLAVIKGSLFYSGLIFISFAIGQSVPILVIGFSTSILKHIMPQTQRLETAIGFIAGNILIVTGIFLIMLA